MLRGRTIFQVRPHQAQNNGRSSRKRGKHQPQNWSCQAIPGSNRNITPHPYAKIANSPGSLMTPVAKTTIWFHGLTNNKQQRTNASKSKHRRRTWATSPHAPSSGHASVQTRNHSSSNSVIKVAGHVLRPRRQSFVGVETERSHLAGHVQRPKKQLCV